jgi:hypothetical protein
MLTIEVLCYLSERLWSPSVAGQQPAAPDWRKWGPRRVCSFGHVVSFRLLWCCRSPAGEPGTLAGARSHFVWYGYLTMNLKLMRVTGMLSFLHFRILSFISI